MAFLSLGKALSSITVAVMRKFILLLPLIYIVPRFMDDKTMGVYLAEPIADVIAVCFTAILFFFQFRKVLREMK
jgi:Na+-driven multidrug efflux pump